jgi:hypothetical protein
VNIIAKSTAPAFFVTLQSASASRKSAPTSAGALANHTRNPALIPNFFGSGVPEYPGMIVARDKEMMDAQLVEVKSRRPNYCIGA